MDEILSKYPFSEGEFLLELTESIMIQNSPSMIQNLARLRERGIQLAIDDLGTGFSSLSYLKHFPVKTLKIDRSFIPDTLDNREDMAICETIIQLAQSLNLDLIAEGIETTEQMEWLITKGVHHAQGFFFAKPVDAETFQNYLILK
ncbi:MAG: EAL domain-containing protein [Reinekea sp.]